ncbi:MAG: DUF167 family protein [Candidatus Kaiserbacteria bacterium]|nr:DUF167 family protein [Candidatus Kaiserbacteria bacterium]
MLSIKILELLNYAFIIARRTGADCVNVDKMEQRRIIKYPRGNMYIKVRVKTGQKKESVAEGAKGSFAISVKEKAERNSANTRVIKVIAEKLGIPVKKIRIISGHHSPSKLLSVPE